MITEQEGFTALSYIFYRVIHDVADNGDLFRLSQSLRSSESLLLGLRIPLRLNEMNDQHNRQVKSSNSNIYLLKYEFFKLLLLKKKEKNFLIALYIKKECRGSCWR